MLRSYDPLDPEDVAQAQLHRIEPWQLALLAMNPSYVYWGPDEDAMADGEGWSSPWKVASWAEAPTLDDLNEVVHFYFSAGRDEAECPACKGDGYHPDSATVTQTFYAHMCERAGRPRSEAWHDRITEDEVAALIAAGRVPKGSTAAQVNAQQRTSGFLVGHDAINRHILIKTRLARLGLPVDCPTCHGRGRVFTTEDARVSLTLWVLHPRKGASRAMQVHTILQPDLPRVFAFLREAAARNAQRFAAIPEGGAS